MGRVRLTPEDLEHLARMPAVIRERIGKLFERLEAWPAVSGAKPLSGNLAGWYRLRTGDYRVRFTEEHPDTLLIHAVLHRREAYR